MKTLALCAIWAFACGCSNNGNGDGGNGTSGGSGADSGNAGPYRLYTLDPASTQGASIAMAVDLSDHVGVAYFSALPSQTIKGRTDYGVMYLQADPATGRVIVGPSQIAVVQNTEGLTLAYDTTGRPAVGFVGGATYDGGVPGSAGIPADAGSQLGNTMGSLFWFQSQAEIAYGQRDGGWDQEICMVDSTANGTFMPMTSDPNADQLINEGFVVGLWPSLLFDGTDAVMVFRDVHFGQFPVQDWAASDAKLCKGVPKSWTYDAPMTVNNAGQYRNAYGGHNQMVLANGKLAMVSDTMYQGAGDQVSGGVNVNFTMQTATGWSAPRQLLTVNKTQTGPALVYGASFGFGVAANDGDLNSGHGLNFISSVDGVNWSQPNPIYDTGSGGYYPSLAVNPVSGQPVVAFYVCSLEAGASTCPTLEDELDVAEEDMQSHWNNTVTVDSEGGFMPKLAFLSTAKKVLAYRDVGPTGAVKLAVEK